MNKKELQKFISGLPKFLGKRAFRKYVISKRKLVAGDEKRLVAAKLYLSLLEKELK